MRSLIFIIISLNGHAMRATTPWIWHLPFEEVEAYKYLGEMINNKGNLSTHIKELEKKVQAATQHIITETGNKEFMATSGLDNHTHTHLWSGRMGTLQNRTPTTTNNNEQSTKDPAVFAPTNPHRYPPSRNRVPPHRKGNKKEKSDAGPQNTP